jgi:hypothetical protein
VFPTRHPQSCEAALEDTGYTINLHGMANKFRLLVKSRLQSVVLAYEIAPSSLLDVTAHMRDTILKCVAPDDHYGVTVNVTEFDLG